MNRLFSLLGRITFVILASAFFISAEAQVSGFIPLMKNKSVQLKVELLPLQASGSCYTIRLRITQIGKSDYNEVVTWQLKYKACDQKNTNQFKTITFEVKSNNQPNSKEISFSGLNMLLEDRYIEGTITEKQVSLPSAEEFDITPAYKGPYFDGEEIEFRVTTRQTNPDINWEWINLHNGSIVAKGPSMSTTLHKGSQLGVRARFGGSTFLSSVRKTEFLQVEYATDLIDFDIVPSAFLVNDTTPLKLSIKSKKELLKGIEYKWYSVGKGDKRLVGSGKEYTPAMTPHLDPNQAYTVVAVYEGNRKIVKKEINNIKVLVLPGPPITAKIRSKPTKIYTKESLTLKVAKISDSLMSAIQWEWAVDGKIQSTRNDSLVLTNPVAGMKISVRPLMNKKKGGEDVYVIPALLVRTRIPESIEGLNSICYGEFTKLSYRLVNAVRGTETKEWVLYENTKQLKRFSTNDFYIDAPSETKVFSISPSDQPGNRFEFTVRVNSQPLITDYIIAPAEVCAERQFSISVPHNYQLEGYKWKWYLTSTDGKRFIGDGASVNTSINKKSSIVLETATDQCVSTKLVVKPVTIIAGPSTPRYTVVKKSINSRIISLKANYQPGDSLTYQWYVNGNLEVKGKELNNYRKKKGENTILLQVTDRCGSTNTYYGYYPWSGNSFGFLNVGISENNYQMPGNFMITAGVKPVYFRAVFNPSYIANTNEYTSLYNGTKIQISNDGRVKDFPSGSGAYYTVSSGVVRASSSFSAGLLIPLLNNKSETGGRSSEGLYLYTGAGYANRLTYWELYINSYAGGANQKIWVKNADQSWEGLLTEAGLFLNVGNRINILGGGSLLFDPLHKTPFISCQAGIGFTFRKKAN